MRSPARGSAVVPFLFFLAFVIAIGLVTLWIAFNGARTAWTIRRALATNVADEQHRTRARVVTGTVSDLGWATELGHLAVLQTKHGKENVFEADCHSTHIDGLRLTDSQTHVVYTLRGIDGGPGRPQSFLPFDEPGHIAVALDPTPAGSVGVDDVPESQHEACRGALSGDGTSYREENRHVVTRGSSLTVRLCPASPSVLEPCGDGLDLVTTRAFAEARSATTHEHIGTIIVGATATFAWLFVLGLLFTPLRSSRKPSTAEVV